MNRYDDAPPKAKRAEPPSVRITQQFRERHNMTYELECSGLPLILRVFFPEETEPHGPWRIEALPGGSIQPCLAATASAPSRPEALEMVARAWPPSLPGKPSDLDWAGITRALIAVRGI